MPRQASHTTCAESAAKAADQRHMQQMQCMRVLLRLRLVQAMPHANNEGEVLST